VQASRLIPKGGVVVVVVVVEVTGK